MNWHERQKNNNNNGSDYDDDNESTFEIHVCFFRYISLFVWCLRALARAFVHARSRARSSTHTMRRADDKY